MRRSEVTLKVSVVRFVWIVFAAVALLPAGGGAARAQAPPKPLTKQDVIRLLKGDVAPKRVAELARQRGISFELTAETEAELRRAGGTDSLLATLSGLTPKAPERKAVSPPVLLIHSTPGRVEVYVDDEFVGKTSADGRLRVSTLAPGEHRVRFSAEGYRESVGRITLAVGVAVTYPAKLEGQAPAPPGSKLPVVPRGPDTEQQGSGEARFVVDCYYVGLSGGCGKDGYLIIANGRIKYDSPDKGVEFDVPLNAVNNVKVGGVNSIILLTVWDKKYEFFSMDDTWKIQNAIERATGKP